VQLNQA
jgi:hypothetical protein